MTSEVKDYVVDNPEKSKQLFICVIILKDTQNMGFVVVEKKIKLKKSRNLVEIS